MKNFGAIWKKDDVRCFEIMIGLKRLGLFAFVGLTFLIALTFAGASRNMVSGKELKACFLQEPKTDDCRFMLWKYEVEHRGGKEVANSDAMAQGVVTGIMVSGATRAAMSK